MIDLTIGQIKAIMAGKIAPVRDTDGKMRVFTSADIHDGADVMDEFGLDSLDLIEVAMELEELFLPNGVLIGDDRIPEMKTPAGALRLLQSLIPQGAEAHG